MQELYPRALDAAFLIKYCGRELVKNTLYTPSIMPKFLADVNRISIYFCKPFMSVMMLRFLFKKIRKVLYFTSERSAFVSLQLIDRTLFQNKQKIKRGILKIYFYISDR